MSVTVLDGRSPFRLTLASPAEVDGSGTVVVTPANLATSAGEFTSAAISGTLSVGGASTLTGNVSVGGVQGLTVANTITTSGLNAGFDGTFVFVVNPSTNRVSMILPTYADQTAAEAGGLVANDAYVTPAGVVTLVML